MLTQEEFNECRDAQIRAQNNRRARRWQDGSAGSAGIEPADVHDTFLYSARIFPNGEFGLGFLKQPKKGIDEKRLDKLSIYDNQFVYAPRPHELEDGTELLDGTDFIQLVDFDGSGRWQDGSDPVDFYTREQTSSPKLGSSAELSQPKKKYGLHGITALGRATLRNAGNILDIMCNGKRGIFPQMGTVTIPSLPVDLMRVLCSNWHIVVKRFFEKCKRLYAKAGLRWDYASCTEIQPVRWETRREVGLHIHFLFVAYNLSPGEWSLPDNWVRASWRGCIESVISKSLGSDINYRRERVHTSSAAYLAKYLTKGGNLIAEVCEELGEDFIPSQWWSCSSYLKSCIKLHTLRSRTDKAALLEFLCYHNLEEYVQYRRETVITTSYYDCQSGETRYHQLRIGYGGKLTASGVRLIFGCDPAISIKKYMGCTLDRV